MEYFISILSILISAATTIIVALIGVNQNKRAKESEDFKALVEENENIRREQEEQRRIEEDERLTRIENSIESLSAGLKDVRESFSIEEIETQLSNLHTVGATNFEYIQSLSNVVTTVGECLSLSDVLNAEETSKMQKEIHAHREKESEINTRLIKIII